MGAYSFLFQGNIGVNVTYGGDHIPKSPFSVGVAPTLDLSKIKISGLGDSMYINGLNTGHQLCLNLLGLDLCSSTFC